MGGGERQPKRKDRTDAVHCALLAGPREEKKRGMDLGLEIDEHDRKTVWKGFAAVSSERNA
jgi:hypothetical protein